MECDCHDEIKGLRSEIAALRSALALAREALGPFAKFVERFDAMPIRKQDDVLYGIHTGTEWEAEIRLSDLRKARALLAPEPKP
jgi:hypothetical protein